MIERGAMYTGRAHDAGVEGNARLTAYTAIALVAPAVVVSYTGIVTGRLIPIHVLVGVLLVPPLLLKLGSVLYRFARYYSGEPRYRAAGPPTLGMRVLGGVLVVLTVAVFASGLELWLFGLRYGFAWVPIHHGSGLLWIVAVAVHVVNYVQRAPSLAVADWRHHLRGATTRRGLVLASLLLGAALAIAALPYPSPYIGAQGG
jgi:hypothetical protein